MELDGRDVLVTVKRREEEKMLRKKKKKRIEKEKG